MDNAYHIREAHSEDIDVILELILGLATYEKAREKVKATPELLQKNLLENKYASTLLAFSGPPGSPDAKPIGMALYFFNFSTWTGRPGLFLEDLYVVPERRGHGIGKALFGHLGRIAKERDCARLDWQVLDWNQPSIEFYEKVLGATMMKEWKGMRLEGDGLDALQQFIPQTS